MKIGITAFQTALPSPWPSPTGRGNKWQGITTMVGLQSSDSLSPWEREQITGNHTIVGFQSSDSPSPWEREQIVGNQNNGRTSVICSLSPWERARERVKQSNPPEALRSARRKVVAWALPTKTGNPIPFAIISTNVIRGQSPHYGSV